MRIATEQATKTADAVNLEVLRQVPAGTEGHPRSTCESCGLFLWSKGGYRIPGLKRLFCSIICIECTIAENTHQRKQIACAPIGSGARLLLYLTTAAPRIHAQLIKSLPYSAVRRCRQCGTALDGQRTDAVFCSRTHMMRFHRSQRSETGQNSRIIGNMSIQDTPLTDAQNAG